MRLLVFANNVITFFIFNELMVFNHSQESEWNKRVHQSWWWFSFKKSTSMAAMSFVYIVSWEWLKTINSILLCLQILILFVYGLTSHGFLKMFLLKVTIFGR